jgi:3'(2'), 5'-bisphosphate nucleotidase
MNPEWLKDLLPEVVRIAKQAGVKIMEVYETGFEVEIKADESPVTTADLAANELIEKELNKLSLFPILSEESPHLSFKERVKQETYWLVDPLDGTKEFIGQYDSFTVNIALIHKNKSILGVVYAPALGVSYYAFKGSGSYKKLDTKPEQKIHVRALAAKPIFAGSRSHLGKIMMAFLENVKDDLGDYDLVSMGSSLKMCRVAEGAVDLYPRLWGTSEWDTAAAHCIVDEAGGKLVRIDLSPLLYNKKASLLNPYFFTIGNNTVDWAKYLPKDVLDR